MEGWTKSEASEMGAAGNVDSDHWAIDYSNYVGDRAASSHARKDSRIGIACRRVAMKILSQIQDQQAKILAEIEILYKMTMEIVEEAPTHDLILGFDSMLDAVSVEFEVPAMLLKGPSREHWVVVARQALMLLIRERTAASSKTVARFLLKKDSGTVRHGCQEALDRFDTEPKYRAKIERLRKQFDSIAGL